MDITNEIDQLILIQDKEKREKSEAKRMRKSLSLTYSCMKKIFISKIDNKSAEC
jgi:hypothetical protein